MGKPIEFTGTVQSRGQEGRKTIEIPSEVRNEVKVGDPVKVTIRKLS
ncbi:hypothetical protein LCGC14_0372480 [marine sediment metagenome]|uniref:Uncharacterized protein n=1 Tax=marine sediment metagenome TaxID=412755 RepID=A0A0F9TMQ9_9ZZZZ